MKFRSIHSFVGRRPACALTLLEVLVVVVLIAIFLGMLLLSLAKANGKPRHPCLNNLKQVGIAYRLFATDHQGRFPFVVSTNEGGSLELGGDAWRQFQTLSNELANPKVVVCPTESKERRAFCVSNFSSALPGIVSYFLNPDAKESVRSGVLSGDRHLTANGRAFRAGLANGRSNAAFHWSRELHPTSLKDFTCGNLLFSDGHAERLTSPELIQRFLGDVPKPIRLLFPESGAAKAGAP